MKLANISSMGGGTHIRMYPEIIGGESGELIVAFYLQILRKFAIMKEVTEDRSGEILIMLPRKYSFGSFRNDI